MTKMFSEMDNEFIKNMMKAQGLNMSDEQISLMKNSEMIKMAQKQIKTNPNMTYPNTTVSNTMVDKKDELKQPTIPQMPTNFDMKSMMDFVSKNPDLLKSMGPMLGGKNGELPPQLETIMYLLSLPQKIKSFFTSTRGILTVGLIVVLVISYFYS